MFPWKKALCIGKKKMFLIKILIFYESDWNKQEMKPQRRHEGPYVFFFLGGGGQEIAN